MKELFRKYKTVVRFVLLFLGTYLVLSLLYGLYLKLSEGGEYFPDFITNLVARQTTSILSGLGYQSTLISEGPVPKLLINFNGRNIAEIIEGCNSVSIIILFISFVISFAEKFKKTFLFIFSGAVLIYIVNVLRIVILVIALYHYPEQENLLHSVVFPGIIYGMVFLLWMLWVKMLSPKPTKS
ncbi:exosortase family protein XrtF [Aequorivita echinoideorum]|uniref:Exosortase family protein XrtF n=1 Tax=Aequorivita echinoideorum TaxID=1549647 RepID=A0ABS5S278_9FLAO|nr:exosortase family protein XrtF [Aequorivita echinoideorum]MBT0607310.1 exosortase family protein XrtF [Aequorivita echinoideorum]